MRCKFTRLQRKEKSALIHKDVKRVLIFISIAIFFDLQKLDSIFLALCDHIFRPQRGLYFSNVRFAQEEHTDTGLSDAAANSVWKFFVDDCFLERKIFSLFTASLL